MTDTEVNIPLLRKAVEWAEAEAAKPDNGQWYQPWTVLRADERAGWGYAGCGTAYCVAGYIAMVETGEEDPYESALLTDRSVCTFAAERIGVDPYVAADLWDSSNTIADVRRIAEDIAGERL